MPPAERDDGATEPQLLFLGHGAERTGPPIVLAHLLRGLPATRPWRRSVLVERGGPLVADYRATGAEVAAVSEHREPLEPLAAALRRAHLADVARRVADERRRRVARRLPTPDLVYVNAATPPTVALLRALEVPADVPVVLHVHELDVGLRTNLADEDRRWLFDRAGHVLAVSRAVEELLVEGHGLDRRRVTRCDGFIEVGAVRPLERAAARRRLGVPVDAPVVGSVGLPDHRKDPDHLLRAVAALGAGAGSPWVVWIGGDPASADGRRLADEAARLGLAERTVHVPHVDDPTALLGGLDVFALPAREDAMPLVALEAAAAALPIVCFRTGGAADLCDRGAGIAVPYPDTVAFGAALRQLLDDDGRRAELGARARALVATDHDLAVGTERIARVLDRALAEGSSGAARGASAASPPQ